MTIVQQTIDELVTLHQLEPGLRDIFVEGPSDADLIRWFLEARGIKGVKVKNIDAIHIPNKLVESQGLTPGAHGRVVTLAILLQKKLGDGLGIRCIADADHMRIIDPQSFNPYLLFTDYTCMEMYAFNASSISKIFHAALGSPGTVASVMGSIAESLREVFLLRGAAKLTGVPLRFPPLDKSCSIRLGALTFDYPQYEARVIQASSAIVHTEYLHQTMASLRAKLPRDARHSAQGHDLIELLTQQARALGNRNLQKDSIRMAMISSLDATELAKETLFASILEFLV